LKKKIFLASIAALALAVGAFAITISHDAPCAAAPGVTGDGPRMKAIVHGCYAGGDALRYLEVARPPIGDGDILVKVHASSVNPYDWHVTHGKPYVMRLGTGIGRPNHPGAGVDFAGTVAAVGDEVTRFRPGDAVFGGSGGAFAEYLVVKESGALAHKPAEISFEQAAALPIAGITALQALRDRARLRRGQRVLINGASGGVGTFAIQIAKVLGAEVTAVCSTRNLELVKSLGADHVVDYTRQDVTTLDGRYDVILDNVGNHSFGGLRKVLTPGGIVVLVGGPKGPWVDPFIPLLKGALVSPFVDERFDFFISRFNAPDFEYLAGLARDGRLRAAISRRYALREVPAALEYLGTRRAQGKVIIAME
jgi:NADPH:quinone reductase-like Zn-dependent oxidoreductase